MTPLPKSFIRAWHDWQRAPDICLPVVELSVEHIIYELEHQSVYQIGLAALGGDLSYVAKRASEMLAAIETLDADLENRLTSARTKEKLREHIALTQRLLEEMSKLSSPAAAV